MLILSGRAGLLRRPAAGVQTTFYVSLAGSDANPGTETQPWQTIAKVNAGVYAAGSTILFRGGDTFSGALSFTASSWSGASSASPVTIGSYGTGRATISSGAAAGASFVGLSGFELQDLNFVGNGAADVNGVIVWNNNTGSGKLPYVRLIDLDVSGYGRNGVLIFGGYGPLVNGTDTAGFDDVLISGVASHGNTNITTAASTAGILIAGFYGFNGPGTSPTHTNVSIINCHSYDNFGNASATQWTGSGIVVFATQGAVIRFCEANNNGQNCDTSGGPVGIFAYDADDVLMEFNESHHNKTALIDGGGFDFDGGVTNSVMQYNYSHDNQGPGFLLYQFPHATVNNWDNNTCRYNISQNDHTLNPAATHSGAIVIASDGDPLTNVRCYNNTVYLNSATGRLIRVSGSAGASTTGLVANNILYSVANAWLIETGAFNPSGLLFRGNDYYATGTWRIGWNGTTRSTLSAFRTATGQEIQASVNIGTDVDPLLVSPGGGGTTGGYVPASLTAYQTQAASPMRDAGLDLQTVFSVNPGSLDYYGNTIPVGAGFDIGAFDGVPVAAGADNVIHGVDNVIHGTDNVVTGEAALADSGATFVPTFASTGIYWAPAGGGAAVPAQVQFRKVGTTPYTTSLDFAWNAAASEYRGSLLMLESGSNYEAQFYLDDVLVSADTFSTWSDTFPIGSTVQVPTGVQSSIYNIDGVHGSPAGYVLYEPADANWMDGKNLLSSIDIRDSTYIIVRGFKITGTRQNPIRLRSGGAGLSDIVIENNEITDWGRIMLFTTNRSGTVAVGDTITGGTSGATGIVVTAPTARTNFSITGETIHYTNDNGRFVDNEVVTATSGGTFTTHQTTVDGFTFGLGGYGVEDYAILSDDLDGGGARFIFQRNYIHDPRADANSWLEPSAIASGTTSIGATPPTNVVSHPIGPGGIFLEDTAGNHVVRWNSFHGSPGPNPVHGDKQGHFLMDCIGGRPDGTTGSMHRDSDIYGNHCRYVWDDSIENENFNINNRTWHNKTEDTFVGFGLAPVATGPTYLFGNVVGLSRKSYHQGIASGVFVKGEAISANPRIFIVHNTTHHQMNYGLIDGMTNCFVRNNIIWADENAYHGDDSAPNAGGLIDYDLYSGGIKVQYTAGANMINAAPTFVAGGRALLQSGSPGQGDALVLPNFGWLDRGAEQTGQPAIEFGHLAGTPAAPVNVVLPAITGTRTQGQTLTSSAGEWNANPAPSFAYQWRHGTTSISGATANTYTLVADDVGTTNINCRVTATNSEGSASATSADAGLISAPGGSGSADLVIQAGADDAMERADNGTVNLTNTTLRAGIDTAIVRTPGMRFTGPDTLPPQGATITTAILTVQSDGNASTALTTRIHAEDTDASAAFTTGTNNITGRPRTTAFVDWTVGTWSSGVDVSSPELASVIQEVVDRPGYTASALTIVFMHTGDAGLRVWEAFETTTTACARLHIEWTV